MTNLIKVYLGVYSGLNNPSFELDEEKTTKISSKILSIMSNKSDRTIAKPKLGEYYGVLLEIPDAISKNTSIPKRIQIFKGVATTKTRQAISFNDTEDIENYILKIAYELGHQSILEKVNAPKPF